MSEQTQPTKSDSVTIDSPVEYGLYALAVHCPELFDDAKRFVGGMLAERQDLAVRVKALMERQALWNERNRYRAALEAIASARGPLIEADPATLGHGWERIAKEALDGE